MKDHMAQDEAVKKVAKLLKGIRIGMMTTHSNGVLRSRPMAQQEADFDGELWFFTKADSAKSDEVQKDAQVNLSFANPDDHRYISISGPATLLRDPTKAKQLWSPIYKAWFPKGLDDPELALWLRPRSNPSQLRPTASPKPRRPRTSPWSPESTGRTPGEGRRRPVAGGRRRRAPPAPREACASGRRRSRKRERLAPPSWRKSPGVMKARI